MTGENHECAGRCIAVWPCDLGTRVFTWAPKGTDEPVVFEDIDLVLLRDQGDGWQVWREVASANLPPDMM